MIDLLSNRTYTGIGNRDTPQFYLDVMTKVAALLEQKQYILRSGGADGADSAFYQGVRNKLNCEIYLPWKGFNDLDYQYHIPNEAYRILENVCPYMDKLTPFLLKLYGRNVLQILGNDLSHPSKFVICYTRDGYIGRGTTCTRTGGTKIAIDLACLYNVPVFNLKITEHYNHIANFFNGDNIN
jgi:hypothetical protein